MTSLATRVFRSVAGGVLALIVLGTTAASQPAGLLSDRRFGPSSPIASTSNGSTLALSSG